MVDDSLNRWLYSRLSLVERLNLQRRDEEADSHLQLHESKGNRCCCCNGLLKDSDKFDPFKRCKTCRGKRRLEDRRMPSGWTKRKAG